MSIKPRPRPLSLHGAAPFIICLSGLDFLERIYLVHGSEYTCTLSSVKAYLSSTPDMGAGRALCLRSVFALCVFLHKSRKITVMIKCSRDAGNWRGSRPEFKHHQQNTSWTETLIDGRIDFASSLEIHVHDVTLGCDLM